MSHVFEEYFEFRDSGADWIDDTYIRKDKPEVHIQCCADHLGEIYEYSLMKFMDGTCRYYGSYLKLKDAMWVAMDI